MFLTSYCRRSIDDKVVEIEPELANAIPTFADFQSALPSLAAAFKVCTILAGRRSTCLGNWKEDSMLVFQGPLNTAERGKSQPECPKVDSIVLISRNRYFSRGMNHLRAFVLNKDTYAGKLWTATGITNGINCQRWSWTYWTFTHIRSIRQIHWHTFHHLCRPFVHIPLSCSRFHSKM